MSRRRQVVLEFWRQIVNGEANNSPESDVNHQQDPVHLPGDLQPRDREPASSSRDQSNKQAHNDIPWANHVSELMSNHYFSVNVYYVKEISLFLVKFLLPPDSLIILDGRTRQDGALSSISNVEPNYIHTDIGQRYG